MRCYNCFKNGAFEVDVRPPISIRFCKKCGEYSEKRNQKAQSRKRQHVAMLERKYYP